MKMYETELMKLTQTKLEYDAIKGCLFYTRLFQILRYFECVIQTHIYHT